MINPKKNNKVENNPTAKDRVDLFPVFKTLYDLVLEFEHSHGQFPKLHKFTVGKRISTALIVSVEKMSEAIVSSETRQKSLIAAIDTRRYERFSSLIVSALAQIGGFLQLEKKHPGKDPVTQG